MNGNSESHAASGGSPQGPSAAGIGKKLKMAFDRIRGVPVEKDLSQFWGCVARIQAFRRDSKLEGKSEEKIALMSEALAARVKAGESGYTARIEAFALVFEASRRTLGLTPHDVQLIAGLAMSDGMVAELPTGEGKTLAAVFPAFLRALSGQGVHVLTFNDYLARRDANWMGPVFRFLGLSVGCIQEGMEKDRKREAYACDITYATAKEAGFDFLRDQLAYEKDDLVHRPFHSALVDEADSILIDEARIPLVVSGVVGELNTHADRLAPLVGGMERGKDFETDDTNRNVFATDKGLAKLEKALGCGNLYDEKNESILAAVHCALHAEVLLHRDIDYIVRGGRIEIVDEFTGRVMDKRHWPDGLQAAVEAKEGLLRRSEGRILGSITLQHFFRLYPRLAGMTATAQPSAQELKEFFGLGTVVIAPHRPCIRTDAPDRVFTHKEAKTEALVREIGDVHRTGRPILVGTLSVRESEELSSALRDAGIGCEVLNAKNDELEAEIVAEAGAPGAVTISTNMAGRGTDIKLGGGREESRDEVVGLGGLYVVGTNRHESLRVDQQLRGRAGRQGDPGSSRFFISLEDDIFERYGLREQLTSRHRLEKDTEDVGDALLHRDILHAQRVIEGQNFDIRKALWNYSCLIETQRKIVQHWRDSLLQFSTPDEPLFRIPSNVLKKGSARFGVAEFEPLKRRVIICHLDRIWADHLAAIADLRESVHLFNIGGKEPLEEFRKSATNMFLELKKLIRREAVSTLISLIRREGPVDLDKEDLRGPSSTWTYLVNDDQAEWGVELLKGRNVGFAAGAGSPLVAPFMALALLAKRWSKSKKVKKEAE